MSGRTPPTVKRERYASYWNAFLFQAGFDDTEIAVLLLEHGAIVNRRTQCGTTPLQSAALQGNKGEIADQGSL